MALLEPGPIVLLTDDQFPTRPALPSIEGTIVGRVSSLLAYQARIDGAALDFANGAAGGEDDGSIDVAEIAAQLDAQPAGVDTTIATVAGNLDGVDADRAANAADVAGDVNAGVPDMPDLTRIAHKEAEYTGEVAVPRGTAIPRDGSSPPPPPPPDTGSSSPPPSSDTSSPWPASAPVARDGSGGDPSRFLALYQSYLDNDLPASLGRAPTDADRAALAEYASRYGYIDNSAYNWVLAAIIS